MMCMDLRELARAQMVLAILVNSQDVHDWTLHVADQVIPVMPEELDGTGVRFASHISLAAPWEGSPALSMDGDVVWAWPSNVFHTECDVCFSLGTRLDPVI